MVRADLVDAILAHARRDHPDEACGVLAGPQGSDRPHRHILMTNAERSPTFYRFDSGEQLAVWQEMEGAGEVPVVIYHSHTATDATRAALISIWPPSRRRIMFWSARAIPTAMSCAAIGSSLVL